MNNFHIHRFLWAILKSKYVKITLAGVFIAHQNSIPRTAILIAYGTKHKRLHLHWSQQNFPLIKFIKKIADFPHLLTVAIGDNTPGRGFSRIWQTYSLYYMYICMYIYGLNNKDLVLRSFAIWYLQETQWKIVKWHKIKARTKL